MAQIHKLESQTFELKCSADKFFDIYNNVSQLTKLFPENYRVSKFFKVMERVGTGSGHLSKRILHALVAKERLRAVDEKNRSINYCVFEGDLMNHYESFDLKLSVTPKSPKGGSGSEGGCLVRWCIKYEKQTQDVPPPNAFIDLMGKIAKGLDAHFLKE